MEQQHKASVGQEIEMDLYQISRRLTEQNKLLTEQNSLLKALLFQQQKDSQLRHEIALAELLNTIAQTAGKPYDKEKAKEQTQYVLEKVIANRKPQKQQTLEQQ